MAHTLSRPASTSRTPRFALTCCPLPLHLPLLNFDNNLIAFLGLTRYLIHLLFDLQRLISFQFTLMTHPPISPILRLLEANALAMKPLAALLHQSVFVQPHFTSTHLLCGGNTGCICHYQHQSLSPWRCRGRRWPARLQEQQGVLSCDSLDARSSSAAADDACSLYFLVGRRA